MARVSRPPPVALIRLLGLVEPFEPTIPEAELSSLTQRVRLALS
jgi:hypothetical protein